MTTPGDDRAQLEARNAAMKNQVDEMLELLEKQTKQLKTAQEAAAQTKATVSSVNGLVTATIDASGMVTDLRFAPETFSRTKPEKLAQTVQEVIRRGTLQVKQQIDDLMSPLTQGLPDLPDFFEGAPSLAGLMPDLSSFLPTPEPPPVKPESLEDPAAGPIMKSSLDPDHPAKSPTPPTPSPAPVRGKTRRDEDFDNEPPTTWLTGGEH